ncbi:MAG: N-acetyltransferase family protein [Euryarchaeota archaeon]|nr:N-acetyltransferase family protein [Euryarchaeota archaeon]
MARGSDAAAVAAIYAPVVRDTAISFEYRPPSVQKMRRRLLETLERYPFLVLETDGKLAGFAYATAHRKREAYRWAVEVSVFVGAAHRRSGAGRALYAALLEALRLQGFTQAFAVITIPNPPSVAFHEGMGFRRVASFSGVGYKRGRWRDTGWWLLLLRRPPARPAPPRPFPIIAGAAGFLRALEVAAAPLRSRAPARPPCRSPRGASRPRP